MEDGAREERVLSAVHGGGKSCEERESMGVSRVPVCGRVGEEEEGRRLCGREAVVGRGEFEQGAVGCREAERAECLAARV